MSPGLTRTLLTAVVALALGLTTFLFRFLSFNGFANDHFVHLSTAQQLLLGQLPVRDFVERGMPLMSALSAVAQVLAPGLEAELVLVATGFAVAATVLFIVAAAAARSRVAAAAATVATVVAVPVSYAYPKHLVYALAFGAAWWYSREPGRGRLVLLAMTVAVAFLFRHDHGIVLAAGAVALLLARHGVAAARPVGTFAVVALAGVAPFAIWVQMHAGIGAYIDDGVAFSRREADRSKGWWPPPPFVLDRSQPLVVYIGGAPVINVRWRDDLAEAGVAAGEREHGLRRLDPVGPQTWRYEMTRWSSTAIAALVGDPEVADTHGLDRQESALTERLPFYNGWLWPGPGMRLADNAVAVLYWVLWATPLVCLGALLGSRAVRQSPVAPLVVMAAVVQLGMNATMLRDPVALRIRDILVPGAVAGAMAVAALWRVERRGWPRIGARVTAVAAVTIVVLASALAGSLSMHLEHTNVHAGLEGVLERTREIHGELAPPRHRMGRIDPQQEAVVAYLAECTTADARVWVMDFAPELFFYSGRGFAGGHVTMTPGYYVTEGHAALIVRRLSSENVPLVLFDGSTREEYLKDYPGVAAFVAERYREAGRLPIRGGEMQVWAEAARMPVRTYGPAALPCFAAAA